MIKFPQIASNRVIECTTSTLRRVASFTPLNAVADYNLHVISYSVEEDGIEASESSVFRLNLKMVIQ